MLLVGDVAVVDDTFRKHGYLQAMIPTIREVADRLPNSADELLDLREDIEKTQAALGSNNAEEESIQLIAKVVARKIMK